MAFKPMSTHKRLLILGCSQSKRLGPQPLPAIDRYNGPAFRVLRKYLAQNPPLSRTPDIYILSAEFGLLTLTSEVPYYDRRMTPIRAQEINARVKAEFEHIIKRHDYQELFIDLGTNYLRALNGYEELLAPRLEVVRSVGPLGRRLTVLHDWLYGASIQEAQPQALPMPKGRDDVRTAYLRGKELKLTPAQILTIARLSLQEGQGKPGNHFSWYVLVDDQRVAPKWLVSQLTGITVSSFHTGEATRVLQQLGIEVRRS